MRLYNLVTAVRNPWLVGKYAEWSLRKFFQGDAVTKTVRGAVTIGGFSGFSEYLAVDEFLRDGEYIFFRDYPFGPGALIDLGANVGVHSIFLAKRYPDRPIFAVEANPHTMSTLRMNVENNATHNIRCCEVALSDREGTVTFNADPVARGTAGIAQGDGPHVIEVPCQSLDRFISENAIGPIAAIKMDVEGCETLVLRGAREMLATSRPAVIYLEIHPAAAERAGFCADEPVRLLLDADYKMFRPNDRGELESVCLEDVKGIVSENWIAIHGFMGQ